VRVVLYTMVCAGKGGVGKTTTTTATVAAERGLRVLVAPADAARGLADAFGRPLGPDPVPLPTGAAAAGSLHAVEIDLPHAANAGLEVELA